jgi:hypothetical protein
VSVNLLLSASRHTPPYLVKEVQHEGDPDGGGGSDIRSTASLASVQAATGQPAAAERSIRSVIESGYMDHHVAYGLGAAHAQLGRPLSELRDVNAASQARYAAGQ